jgi:hypothetical protein
MTNCTPPGSTRISVVAPDRRFPHGVDRAVVQLPVVVGEGERAEPLPNGENAIEAASIDATCTLEQPSFAEPGA